MGFTMQDILLEPYGGQVMHLSVSATTALTAVMACGSLVAFALAAHRLARGHDPYRIAALGVLTGVVAFSAVVFAQPTGSDALFRVGTFLIGLGGGLFSVATLTIAMGLDGGGSAGHGLALGAWGSVQASAAGIGIAVGGGLRDLVADLAASGLLGATPDVTSIGYTVVYHVEIALLFATLAAIGPLVRRSGPSAGTPGRFGLAEFPG
jgi:BCD family chlorophyll transporter-like MFS transporter